LSDKACKSWRGGKTKQRIENGRKKLSEIASEKLFLAALSAFFYFFERYSLCNESKSVQCRKVIAYQHHTLTKQMLSKRKHQPLGCEMLWIARNLGPGHPALAASDFPINDLELPDETLDDT